MAEAISGGNQLLNPQFILEKAEVREGALVADFGCGAAAHFVFPASAMVGKDGKVFAVDVLPAVLQKITQRAREENKANIIPVWSDLEVFRGAKDIPDNTLDIGMLINTLFQSKNKEAMMRESARMVKRGGRLLVVEWKMAVAPFGPAASLRIAPDAVRSLAHGLQLEESYSFEAGPYHYGILFKKI